MGQGNKQYLFRNSQWILGRPCSPFLGAEALRNPTKKRSSCGHSPSTILQQGSKTWGLLHIGSVKCESRSSVYEIWTQFSIGHKYDLWQMKKFRATAASFLSLSSFFTSALVEEGPPFTSEHSCPSINSRGCPTASCRKKHENQGSLPPSLCAE